jgi:hypothetical protein
MIDLVVNGRRDPIAGQSWEAHAVDRESIREYKERTGG